jgi:transmembrane sensor
MRPADAESPDHSQARGETPATETALQWLKRSSAEQELIGAIATRVGRRRRRRLAIVSSACLGLAVAGLVWRSNLPAPFTEAPIAAVQPTATILAPARQVLPDGSLVELKDGAAIAHDYTDDRRDVTLLRGEAHFQVEHNPSRPFVVTAGGVAVRAVGTAFSVQFGTTAVEVLVTEGRVAVEKTGSANQTAAVEEPALLHARDHAFIRHTDLVPEVNAVAATDLAKRLAWRVPQLEFSRTPLSEVISLMNEHGGNERVIVASIPSAELAEMKLSGFLAADNADGLVRLLEANFQITAEREEGTIRLRRKAN